MCLVLIIFSIEKLNFKNFNFVLYFVRETRSTSPQAYAIFHVLRQGTTAQSTSCFKQSLSILNIILYFILYYFIQLT